MAELKVALRRFRRQPGRGVAAVLTLGLGIAASTAAFSVVEAVLLAPLPVETEKQLVVLWQRSEARDFEHVPFLPAGFDAVSEMDALFDGVAAHETSGARPALGEGPDATFAINQVRVAGDFFGVLGASPTIGRLLGRDDDALGAAPSVVISHDFWVQNRGADPAVLGTTLRYNDVSYTVVGVSEAGFDYPSGTQAWSTLRGTFPDWATEEPSGIELDLVARLRRGVTPSDAFAGVDQSLDADASVRAVAGDLVTVGAGFRELVVGNLGPVLRAALGAALLLLLVAIANTVLLLLSGGRRVLHEAAIRRALGASERGGLRPFLADAALHASLGVLVGVGLTGLVVRGLIPLAPNDFARFDEVTLDIGHLAFAVALGGASVLLSGVLVGVWFTARDPRHALVGLSRAVVGGGQSLRGGIAVVQVALAVLASAGAALLWQSVGNLEALDHGFDAEDLYVVSLTLPFSFFEMPDDYPIALGSVVSDLEARAGIVAASPTLSAPLFLRGGIDFAPTLEGQTPEDARSNPFIGLDAVLPQYFAVSGTRLLEGRHFGDQDGPDASASVIVNEATAILLWPGQSAIGRRFNMGGVSRSEWRTVVGVVEDQRFRSFPEIRPAAYLPLAQFDRFPPARLIVRTDGVQVPLRQLVSESWASTFPGVQVLAVESMEGLMARPLLRPRFAAFVLIFFASVALVLAAMGVYGVLSALVQDRVRELGVRMALGAAAADILRFMIAKVLFVALFGGVLGVSLSLAAAGFLEALVFGVSPRDVPTMLAALSGAVLLCMVAGTLPTLRAIRTDPVVSLRAE